MILSGAVGILFFALGCTVDGPLLLDSGMDVVVISTRPRVPEGLVGVADLSMVPSVSWNWAQTVGTRCQMDIITRTNLG